MIRRLTIAALILFTAGPAPADDTPSPAERDRLKAEIQQLDVVIRILTAAGKRGEVVDRLQDQQALWRRLDPAGEPDPARARGLLRLARAYHDLGSPLKALPLADQALAMCERLYPEAQFPHGHADLVAALDAVAYAVFAVGGAEKSVPFARRAFALREKQFAAAKLPDNHPQRLHGLIGIAFFLHMAQHFPEAQTHLDRAVAMARALYPKSQYPGGHRNLAEALFHSSHNLQQMGRPGDARPLQEEGVAMFVALKMEKLSPDGPAELAFAVNLLGNLRDQTGDTAAAVPLLLQAAETMRQVHERAAAEAAEDDAFALLRATPPLRDNYLAAARKLPGSDPIAYAVAARAKGAITRVLAARAAAVRAAPPEKLPERNRLREVRRQVEALLLCGDIAPADRDARLVQLTTEIDRLERALARALPCSPARPPFDPADLLRALPAGSAFVDFFTYNGQYTAFVLAPGRPIQWVDLPGATTGVIQAKVESCRTAIQALREPDLPALAKLIWEPVVAALPASTRTLYVSPQDHLWHLPWAALPGRAAGRVLLEEFPGGIALVQHATDLLDGLTRPTPPNADGGVLTLAGVDYGPPPGYRPLPGTAEELSMIRSLAEGRTVVELSGSAATAPALLAGLPRTRYAHLATHGFAADKEFAAEVRREKELPHRWTFQPGGTATVPSVYNRLLAYSGLVLAGANRPTPAETGIVTGPRLADLNLEHLRLCVLSACDTGHGQLIGGEGTFGLARAFHLAGCPNVVASLWPVNDESTPALMAKFYHELWVNRRPPLEALRAAQLTIYRGGGPAVAALRDRSKPDFQRVIQQPAGELETAAPSGRSPVKLWAGFVLSGPGR